MQIHFWDRRPRVLATDQRKVRVWCGREVVPALAARALGQVSCQQCRNAFARECEARRDALPPESAA